MAKNELDDFWADPPERATLTRVARACDSGTGPGATKFFEKLLRMTGTPAEEEAVIWFIYDGDRKDRKEFRRKEKEAYDAPLAYVFDGEAGLEEVLRYGERVILVVHARGSYHAQCLVDVWPEKETK